MKIIILIVLDLNIINSSLLLEKILSLLIYLN